MNVMSIFLTNMKTPQTKTEKKEDKVFTSKNHSKSVRFRIRLQQQKEAEQEIHDFKKQKTRGDPRVS